MNRINGTSRSLQHHKNLTARNERKKGKSGLCLRNFSPLVRQRIKLADLYDAMLAVATSDVQPLSHQIRIPLRSEAS